MSDTRRADEIYERSTEEALGSAPDFIESGGDGVLWLVSSDRAMARSYYAAEFGVPFTRVRATREWLAPNLDAIRDLANDLAALDPDEVGDEPVAYTWEGDGFVWSTASKDDPGAVLFWRCEEYSAEREGR